MPRQPAVRARFCPCRHEKPKAGSKAYIKAKGVLTVNIDEASLKEPVAYLKQTKGGIAVFLLPKGEAILGVL